jgi:hypothetical protein
MVMVRNKRTRKMTDYRIGMMVERRSGREEKKDCS